MYEPLVSVIIPVYNGSDYMREAIDSALSQTYKNIEVIVVNDGSSDGGKTDKIARSYGDKIRYFVKENGGVSSALNVGIKEMCGEYFSWLSHDDVYQIDKIERQVSVLTEFNINTVVCCNYTQIDEHSRPLSGYMPASAFAPNIEYAANDVLAGLLTKSNFNGCCLLIPREVLIKCGMFDEKLRFCQDVFMWYKIFLNGCTLRCIDDASVKSRVHSKQLTQTGQSLFKYECNAISDFLWRAFANQSSENYNFLKMYLLSDSKYLALDKVKTIIKEGKKQNLISGLTAFKAYLLYGYGKIRPLIRKIYYGVFRNINT